MSTLFDTNHMKINKITPDKHEYFSVLSAIPKPPKNMFFIGTTPIERIPTVAIVGTRKPTTYGKEVTWSLARHRARQGIVIVSGLALVIDAIAQKAALDASGTTLAILANSVDHI